MVLRVHRRRALRLFAAIVVPATSIAAFGTPARAQVPSPIELTSLAVPRFDIVPSAIELTGPVRPGEYLGVVGPRAAWLGLETGEAELWVHPLKVGNGFRLSFSAAGNGAPIPGDQVARTVQVRPELATITYSHAAFQVRQHILAPADTATSGLLVLLEVDTPEPLEIVAEFEPVLNYMWPGSLGGQYAYWDAERRLFVLSESLQTRNAVVGSPWATNSVEHPAHQLGEAPRTMVIPVDPERAGREFIPIAVAAGSGPREAVFESYRELIANARGSTTTSGCGQVARSPPAPPSKPPTPSSISRSSGPRSTWRNSGSATPFWDAALSPGGGCRATAPVPDSAGSSAAMRPSTPLPWTRWVSGIWWRRSWRFWPATSAPTERSPTRSRRPPRTSTGSTPTPTPTTTRTPRPTGCSRCTSTGGRAATTNWCASCGRPTGARGRGA